MGQAETERGVMVTLAEHSPCPGTLTVRFDKKKLGCFCLLLDTRVQTLAKSLASATVTGTATQGLSLVETISLQFLIMAEMLQF